jgi:WD40 repeat protein
MSARFLLSTVFIVLNVCILQPSAGLADVWTSPNGKYVAFHAGGRYDRSEKVSVWDFRTGKEKCRIDQGVLRRRIAKVAISDVSGLVATVTPVPDEPDLHAWDIHTGELLWSNSKPDDPNSKFDDSDCEAIAFSSDGKRIATLERRHDKLSIAVFQSDNGRILRTIEIGEGTSDMYPIIEFSPTGDSVFTYFRNDQRAESIRCWELNTGKHLGDYQLVSHPKISIAYGSFAVGSDFIVQEVEMCETGGINRRTMVVVWDAKNRTEIRRIYTDREYFSRSAISLCEARGSVFVKVHDRVCREFDINTGEEIASILIPRGDGVGLGGGSTVPVPQSSAVIWSCNHWDRNSGDDREALGISVCRQGKSWSTAATFQALEKRKDSAIVLAKTKEGVVTGEPKWVGTINVTRVLDGEELWNNYGINARDVRSEPRKVNKLLAELSVPLPDRGVKRIDRSKPRLFILGVGVSDHELDEKDLVYAASDARSLVEKFEAQHGSVYGDVQVKLYEDKRVTPDSVRDGLNWLAQSSTERDVVVLFFSGHGMRGRKGLYYFTHHGDEENLQNTCVNWSDVAKSLAATKASQILFLSDCCHAGAFSKDHFLNQADLAKAIDSVENVAILASCTGEEGSLELDEFKHGAFTQALLEALDGAGDLDGDGNSTWREILDYVLVRVPKITGNEQHPIELKAAKSPKALILSTRSSATGVEPPTSKAVVSPRQ